MADDRRDRPSKRPPPTAILDRVRQLRDQVLQQQDYDTLGWREVVDDLLHMFAHVDGKAALEEVVQLFPSAAPLWTKYVEFELGPGGNTETAKALFGRCLLTCPTVPLYRQYLRLVKLSNEGKGAEGVLELRAAYEFALDQVGQDWAAGELWLEYLQFLQAPKPGTEAFSLLFPGGLEGQEEAVRTKKVRHEYQRAVLVPTKQLEGVWRQYEAWEIRLDKQLWNKMSADWRPRYQAARNIQREREKRRGAIIDVLLPFPADKGGVEQAEQVSAWHDYLDWEASNPQRLEPDSPMLLARVQLAYRQCLMILRLYPEMWLSYAQLQLRQAGTEAALAVLAQGEDALPGCGLLRFARAELCEADGRVEAAQQVYADMADVLDQEIPSVPLDQLPTVDGEAPQSDAVLSPFGGEQGVLIWLQYVKFLRRTATLGEARQVFLRARRWQQASIALAPRTPPDTKAGADVAGLPTGGQLYVGMARLEWSLDHSSPAVPCRVLELGLEDPRLSRDAGYISAYSAFLCDIGDVDNARALYERMLADPDVSCQAEVWRGYAVLEQQHGNLSAALQVAERMRAALVAAADMRLPGRKASLPLQTASLQVTLCRYTEGGLVPCDPALATHLRVCAGLGAPAALAAQGDVGVGRESFHGGPRLGPEPRGGWRGRGDRDRDRDRDRDYERPRGGWEREGSFEDRGPPPPGGPRGGWDSGPPPPLAGPPPHGGPPELMEVLLSQLPGPQLDPEDPPVPVDAVMDVIMFADMSAPAVAHVCAELEVGALPSGANGVAVPQILEAARPRPHDLPPPYDLHDRGPPPPVHPHDPYPPPYDPRDPYGPPGPRKRRWESMGWDEGRGPPPPYDDPYGGPPPPDPYAPDPYGPPPPGWHDDRRGPPPPR